MYLVSPSHFSQGQRSVCSGCAKGRKEKTKNDPLKCRVLWLTTSPGWLHHIVAKFFVSLGEESITGHVGVNRVY
jgi:hypothetical protein